MKRIIVMLLALCLCFGLCACGENAEDKALAIACAEEAAQEYYDDYLHGESVGTGEYTGCEVSTSSTEYSDGQYIVTVALKIEAVEGTYGIPVRVTQNIKYTIEVDDGQASIVHREYLDIE